MAEIMSSQTYREVYLPASSTSKWKEITLNTGASVSTLQDIKVPESCGGYTYKDSGLDRSPMRNRFIYWKSCNDVLELVEESFDLDLYASRVKFHFQDTAILGGVSIHEAQGHVIVLVPTVASVHRLVFPHPSKLQRTDLGYVPTDHPVPSIFYDASIAGSLDQRNTHMINPGGSITSHYHSAATHYTLEGEALFALASSLGSILLVKMPLLGIQGITQQFELTQSSVMQKLWSGLVPSVIRGGQEPSDTTSSLVISHLRGDPCILAVCRDHRLRIWSCKSHDCVLVCNLLDFTPDGAQMQSKPAAGAGHIIRKFTSSDAAELKFGVHLNFIDRNQFCIFKPEIVSGRLQLAHIASVFGPNEELTDFAITASNIISLWTSSEGTSVVRTLAFGEEGPGLWSEVILQPAEIADLNIPPHRDPREVYLERLFQPRRFSMSDIRRALSLQVYSQSIDSSTTGDAALNVNKLREDVTVAVESEIRDAAVDFEMQEEDYYQLQLEQWTKFYSCCIQYHEVGGKLKGIFADSVTGLIGMIRKGCVTYLRPCDKIEELYYGSISADPEPLLGLAYGNQDNQLKRDLCVLWETLRAMSLEISEDLAIQFEHEVSLNQDMTTTVTQLIDNILLTSELEEGVNQSCSLSRNLRLIHSLPDVLRIVLQALDLSGAEEELDLENDLNAARQRSLSKLFTSKVGTEVLSTSVEQFAQTRFSTLRDLYILEMAAIRLGDQVGVTADIVRTLQNELMPYTANLLRAYLVLKWTTNTLAVTAQANTVDVNIRALSSLDISESTVFSTQKSNTVLLQKLDHYGASLMDLFIQSNGGEKARSSLAMCNDLTENPHAVWVLGLQDFVKNLAKLVWPLCENFLFPEFLVGCCQYLPVQEYFNLLQPWCEYNAASRCFIQGLSYLHYDEPVKAAHCFNRARDGVANESFLRERLLQTDESQIRKLEVLYYLKVLQQFEEFGAPDVVISLAKTAIGIADDDDPNVPTLWSKVFKYQLELGHNTEAYNAMIENPDPSRRKDCLRQLLIMLCDRGDLQSLVDFPYTDLEEEVENILESRARSMDLLTHNYYDLLYAFHIFRNNYRKAGSVMYEHGMRLGREVPGKQGLQRQAQCYLSALNALRLVKPEYAWIIKPNPLPRAQYGAGDTFGGRSPKHGLDGEEVGYRSSKSKFEILELHDIEKEFMLVDARLRLISKEPDTSIAAGAAPAADETVGLLVNAGLFDRAVIICRAFDLQLHSIFENLALRCVNLAKHSSYHMRGDNDYTSQAWDWLKTNNLTLTNIAKDNSSADQAWQLLQQYLDKYEDNTAIYHRCTANKLLAHGFTLPSWFVNSYKGLNSAELLRLYIDYDLLEEAVALCVEYIDAVVDTFKGQDCEVFQLKGCLHHQPLSAWLPYTSIDLLLKALHDHRQDVQYGTMYGALQDKLTIYTGKLREISTKVSHNHQEQYLIS